MGEDKYRLILERQNADEVQTLGTMYVVNEADRIQFKCWSLELIDKHNKRNISRIPAGNYKVVKRWSKKFKDHLHVLDVDGRSMILIHVGNTYADTRGCILVGNDLGYIDGNEHLDVLNSRDTLDQILELLGKNSSIMVLDFTPEETEKEEETED